MSLIALFLCSWLSKLQPLRSAKLDSCMAREHVLCPGKWNGSITKCTFRVILEDIPMAALCVPQAKSYMTYLGSRLHLSTIIFSGILKPSGCFRKNVNTVLTCLHMQ